MKVETFLVEFGVVMTEILDLITGRQSCGGFLWVSLFVGEERWRV